MMLPTATPPAHSSVSAPSRVSSKSSSFTIDALMGLGRNSRRSPSPPPSRPSPPPPRSPAPSPPSAALPRPVPTSRMPDILSAGAGGGFHPVTSAAAAHHHAAFLALQRLKSLPPGGGAGGLPGGAEHPGFHDLPPVPHPTHLPHHPHHPLLHPGGLGGGPPPPVGPPGGLHPAAALMMLGAAGQGGPGAGAREMLPFYPWLMSRHGAYLRPDGFLLQPFRKPKRIRTAFSPSQLLQLEHAFEKNHYVVGQERKELAQSLNLSETQVKVWFQNRRTKYKRVKSEEEDEDGTSGGAPRSPGALHHHHHSGGGDSRDSDSELDLEDEDDDDDEIDISGPPPQSPAGLMEHHGISGTSAAAFAAARLAGHWPPPMAASPMGPPSPVTSAGLTSSQPPATAAATVNPVS